MQQRLSLLTGEHKNGEEIDVISKAVLAKTGHQDCQYFVVEHHDRKDHHQAAWTEWLFQVTG